MRIIVELLEKKFPMTRSQIAKAVGIKSGHKTLKRMLEDGQIQLAGDPSGTELYAAKSQSITRARKRVLAKNEREPEEVQRSESMAKGIASFWDPGANKKTENVLTLSESHALAMRYECKDAAAVICQTIAACKPQESGYAVICDVSLSYAQHYNNHEKRQWGKDKAEGLEPYKHDLAKLAIENIEEIKEIYKDCLGSYRDMSDIERKKAATEFRKRMQLEYGGDQQNAWTHRTVYKALVDRGEIIKKPSEKRPMDQYVRLYSPDKNCVLLYPPGSRYMKAPFHTNDSRLDDRWQDVLNQFKYSAAIEFAHRDNKGKGKEQDFDHYSVKDWTKFAEAVGLTARLGSKDHTLGDLAPTKTTENTLAEVAEELEQHGEFDPTGIEDARKIILRAIVLRQGRKKFREQVLSAYERRCAITGCPVEDVLEAAHIVPYKGVVTDHPSNGLLLRADFHTLFDLHLVAIHEATMKLLISTKLNDPDYKKYRGKKVRIPKEKSRQPSCEALKQHRIESGLG